MRTREILVVDDDIHCLNLVSLLLEIEGFDVAVTSNGIEALEMLGNGDFRVLITDYNMPEMNGLDLAIKVRERHPEIHVVMVTADIRSGIVEAAAEAGVSRIFNKPFNVETFLTTIRSCLYPKESAMPVRCAVFKGA